MVASYHRVLLMAIMGHCFCRGQSQSLIPNGSFEEFTINCASGLGYQALESWSGLDCGSYPGLAHSCNGNVPLSNMGFQYAMDGDAFIVTWTLRMNIENFPDGNPQTYANVDLTEPLVADQHYCLRLWMNMADSSNYKTGAFHAFLWYGTPTICNYNDTAWDTHAAVTFDISQVDSVEWTLLEGEFIASGGESNITLGAFQFGSEIDSVLLHHSPGGDLAMYFIDNVQLWACQVGVNESIDDPHFAVYPIPASDVLNVSIRGSHLASLVVIDALGRTVTPATWTGRFFDSGTHALDVGALAPGQYLLEVKTRDGVAGTKRFVIAR